jgi:predicted nucleic acid-binding protein
MTMLPSADQHLRSHFLHLGPRYATVLDTNVLMNDLLYRIRNNRCTALVECLMIDALRAYVPSHILEEVLEHLPARARRSDVSAELALQVWTDEYAPLLRVVNASDLPSYDERIANLADRDPDDVPSAALVLSLASCLSLSADRDLTDQELAIEPTANLHRALRAYAQGEQLYFSVQIGGNLAAIVSQEAVAAIARSATAQRLALAFGLLLVAGAIWLRWGNAPAPVSERLQRWWCSARAAGLSALTGTAKVMRRHRQGQLTIECALVRRIADDELNGVLGYVATSDYPPTATEIGRAIGAAGEHQTNTPTVRQILDYLSESSAFVRIGRSRWQVGAVPVGAS